MYFFRLSPFSSRSLIGHLSPTRGTPRLGAVPTGPDVPFGPCPLGVSDDGRVRRDYVPRLRLKYGNPVPSKIFHMFDIVNKNTSNVCSSLYGNLVRYVFY